MIMVDELWAQDSKVADQSDKTVLRSNSLSFQSGDGLPIVLGVHLWQSLIVKNDRRHLMFPSYLKRSDAWLVADDNIHSAFSNVLSINGIQDRFKIGAASRDQDTDRNQDYLLVPVRLLLRYAVSCLREFDAMSKAITRTEANPRNFLASFLSIVRSLLLAVPLYLFTADLITGVHLDESFFIAQRAAPSFETATFSVLKG